VGLILYSGVEGAGLVSEDLRIVALYAVLKSHVKVLSKGLKR
jgi:hypothetical protein